MNLPASFQLDSPLQRAGIWPGLLLALALALAARYFSALIGMQLGFPKSPVSPILLAILIGLGVRNLAGLSAGFIAGVNFAQNNVLKLGVVLLGIRLSLDAVGAIGVECIPIVIGCIVSALIVVNLLSRWLGVSAGLGTLIAVGTSICGCTAILATAPAIRARESEVCYAVSCVALFGTMGMLVYPFLAQQLFGGDPLAAGMFLGTAIHDTAQVVGAGLLFEQYFQSSAGLEAATVTKLVRNLSMVIIIPALTFAFARQNNQPGESRTPLKNLVPLFIVGFIAMSLFRTVGDLGDAAFGVIPPAVWQMTVGSIQQISEVLLAVAMAAVGLGTSFAGIRQIGLKPLGVGLAATVLVGCVSFGLIRVFVQI
jgi:uncharacterized integral membrane protein (TIGR00698 family)